MHNLKILSKLQTESLTFKYFVAVENGNVFLLGEVKFVPPFCVAVSLN